MSDRLQLFFDTNVDSPSYGHCDLAFSNGDALESAVLMSLFCDRRVNDDELANTDHDTKGGWWYDDKTRLLGSKLWLYNRSKLTPEVVNRIKATVQESLQWMIEDRLCANIQVITSRYPNGDALGVNIRLNKDDGSTTEIKFDELWRVS